MQFVESLKTMIAFENWDSSNIVIALATAAVIFAISFYFIGRKSLSNEEKDKKKIEKQRKKASESWDSHVLHHGKIKEFADGFWVVQGSNSYPLPRNMVIYRMQNGNLMLHSVIALNEETMAELEQLGTPEIMIVPSSMHMIDAAVYKVRFPGIKVYTPQYSISSVEEVVPVDGACEDLLPYQGVDYMPLEGCKPGELVYEVVLEDSEKKGLIFNDAIFNLGKGDAGFVSRLLGSIGDGVHPIVTRLGRMMMVDDKEKVRKFYENLREREDVGLVSMSHGNVVLDDIPDKFSVIVKQF